SIPLTFDALRFTLHVLFTFYALRFHALTSLDLQLAKEIADFPPGGIGPVRPVHGVLFHVRAEVTANGASVSLGWVGRPHEAAVGADRLLPLKNCHQNRPG